MVEVRIKVARVDLFDLAGSSRRSSKTRTRQRQLEPFADGRDSGARQLADDFPVLDLSITVLIVRRCRRRQARSLPLRVVQFFDGLYLPFLLHPPVLEPYLDLSLGQCKLS